MLWTNPDRQMHIHQSATVMTTPCSLQDIAVYLPKVHCTA